MVRRATADVAAKAGPVEVRLTPEDPAKLLTVRGKLLDHRGNGARGAELRLVVTTGRAASREYPFNWVMIESGRVAQAAGVLQFRTGATAGDGGFEFRGVPDGAEIELAYRARGIPPGRLDHVEALSAAEQTGLVVRSPAPARLAGTVDRTAFPEVGVVRLNGPSRYFTASLAADGKSFAVEDLPAGQYEVQVYGPRKLVEGRRNRPAVN